MKIAYDAKRAVMNMTGLGNYSRLVIDVMSRDVNNRCLLLTPRIRPNDRLEPLLKRVNVDINSPEGAWKAFPSLWRTVRGITSAARREKVDIYHGLSAELPLDIARSGIPSIVTVHDLIFRRYPRNFNAVDRMIYDAKARAACRAATRIIAISQRTRDDIVELYDIDPSKIDVVYQGCDPIFSRPVSAQQINQVRTKYNLPTRYIICVGTVEDRKNQMQAVEALGGIPGDVHLVIVGKNHGNYHKNVDNYIALHNLTRRVHRLENVPFADLPPLYAGAAMASYTSYYEGFGLPVIEAISAGTPVIAAKGSCLEEAGGPGALYVNPDKVDDYIEKALQLLDTDTAASMVEAGRRHVARFSLENFQKDLNKVYCQLL